MTRENGNTVGAWLAGILAAIISGVAVYYLTEGSWRPLTSRQDEPISQPSEPESTQPSESEPTRPSEARPSQPSKLQTFSDSDIGGIWQGTLVQNRAPITYDREFIYRLDLSKDGSQITGTSVIQNPQLPSSDVAHMEVRGNLSQGMLEFSETSILQASPINSQWCLKSFLLTHNKSENTLEGTWTSDGCSSGEIVLSKQ